MPWNFVPLDHHDIAGSHEAVQRMIADSQPNGGSMKIICPKCGNDGDPEKKLLLHGPQPFNITERVIRSWPFKPADVCSAGVITLDSERDTVDYESGDGYQIECRACLNEWPLPDGYSVNFDVDP